MGRKYASKWDRIIAEAARIAESYDTGVTLRQLYYRLVAAELIENNDSSYNYLSQLTAEARRNGEFPDLIDTTRRIEEPAFFDSPADAIGSVIGWYRSDRLIDQTYSVYLGVEKRGLIAQLESWFGKPYNIPILPLGGQASQTFINDVNADVERREEEYGRKSVLLYAGDFDASGIAIDRVFTERTNFTEVRRIALDPDQITDYGLVRQKGKPLDSNVDAFFEKYDEAAWFEPLYAKDRSGASRWWPVQVEMDALDPNDLRQLFAAAIGEFLDVPQIEARVEREIADRKHLNTLAGVARRFTTAELRRMMARR
jgi:hypothetical protein